MAGLLAQRIKRFLIEKGPVSLIYTLLLIGSLLRLADLRLVYIAAACGFCTFASCIFVSTVCLAAASFSSRASSAII